MTNKIALLFFVVTLAVLGSFAEPPRRYRNQRLSLTERQEVAAATTTTSESATEETTTFESPPYAAAGFQPGREFNEVESTTGPYAPSGWKPSGQLLAFPVRQQQTQQTYGVPSLVYGAAAKPTDEENFEDIETVSKMKAASEGPQINETTDEPESEVLPAQSQTSGKQEIAEQSKAPGLYFIQLPDGSYQQFVYYAAPAAKLQAQPILQAAQPVFFNPLLAPRTVSYSSQYQSW